MTLTEIDTLVLSVITCADMAVDSGYIAYECDLEDHDVSLSVARLEAAGSVWVDGAFVCATEVN